MKNIDCLVLTKEIKEFKDTKVERKTTVYFVANGLNMGRWTSFFGVHCLADTEDTKQFLKLKAKEIDKAENPKIHNFQVIQKK